MMERRLILGALLLLASCTSLAGAEEASNNAMGRAFYFSFDIERITGIPEGQMEEYGCQYQVQRADFERALGHELENANAEYNARDVRAKVVFDDGVFFVDRQGTVRSSMDKYFLIDKPAFVSALKLEKCR